MQLFNGTVRSDSVRKLPCGKDMKEVVECRHRESGRFHEQQHRKQCPQLTVRADGDLWDDWALTITYYFVYNNSTIISVLEFSRETQPIGHVYRDREIYCKGLTHKSTISRRGWQAED